MKVGILTFHESANYGAVLQAYALQKVINRSNECEIVDYRSANISASHKLERMSKDKSIKGMLKKLLVYGFYEKRNARFQAFLEAHCHLSKERYTKDNIADANELYDCFVSGSDQILNLRLTANDYAFYLDFVEKGKMKVAYAASIGNYALREADGKAKDLLTAFDRISSREKSVSQEIEAYAGVASPVVLDPTFLLEKKNWEEIEEKIEVPDRFILLYFVSPEKEYFDYAVKFAEETNLPIYYINYSYKKYKSAKIRNLTDVSPGQFLYLIHKAAYVLTNSFHGTALSIGYEKQFYVILDSKREKGNQRMKNILSELDLTSCCATLDADISDVLNRTIDYSVKKERLPVKVAESLGYLSDSGVIEK